MGTASVECDRILTDDDFKMIKRLRRKQAEEKAAKNNPHTGAGPAMHMPGFDFLKERANLKMLSMGMQKKFEEEHRREERLTAGGRSGMEEEDLDGEEESGDEEIEEGDDEFEGMDEEGLEEGDEEEEDGDEEDGDEEGDEEELEIGEDDGEIIEEADFEKMKSEDEDDSDMVGSSFYEESDDEFEPSAGFLQASSILNRNTFKRKVTRDQVKLVKAEQREEHRKLKLGAKIKQRGRLTNRQKQKNNPYQMFIQKKRLQNRLKDLKKEHNQKKNSKLHKGHQRSNRLGKSSGKKF